MVHKFAKPNHEFTKSKLRFDTQVMITCVLPSVAIVLVPMLQFTQCYTRRLRKKKPRCKHSDEVILFALECTHLDCCILSGVLHKSQPWFAHEENFESFTTLIAN
jgi:hypothetical protein